MATEWIMVRLDRHTHAELERVRASMMIADAMGLVELHQDSRGRVSLSQVIDRLIAFRERHAARARRSKERRRLRSAESDLKADNGGSLNQGGASEEVAE
jgi:hypothetical protein